MFYIYRGGLLLFKKLLASYKTFRQAEKYYESYRREKLPAVLKSKTRAEDLKIVPDFECYGVVLIRCGGAPGSAELYDAALALLGELYPSVDMVTINADEKAYLICCRSEDISVSGSVFFELDKISKKLGFEYYHAMSMFSTSKNEIHSCFQFTVQQIEKQIEKQMEEADKTAETETEVNKYIYYVEASGFIAERIKSGDFKGAVTAFCAFCDAMEASDIDIRAAKKHVFNLMYDLSGKLDDDDELDFSTEITCNRLFSANIFEDFKIINSISDINFWFAAQIEAATHPSAEEINRIPVDKLELVENLKAYLKANYMREININAVAEMMFFSAPYLSRLFKKTTGISFNSYIIKLKLENASRFLLVDELKITDVAKKVGYSNIQSFTKIFKEYYGYTPSEFRKKHAAESLMSG